MNSKKKAAATTAAKKEEKPAAKKSGLKFAKVASDVTNFFQFSGEIGETFTGKFLKIRPETDGIQGLDFDEVDEEANSKGIKTLPSYYNLLKFFQEKEADENIVYQIELIEKKDLAKGQQVFLFEISACDLSESEEESAEA